MDEKVLNRASEFLANCASDMGAKPVKTSIVKDDDMKEASLFDGEEQGTEELESHTSDVTQETTSAVDDTPTTSAPDNNDVNALLSIPHDGRIHSSGKTKYASNSGPGKAKGQWIYKRGVTPESAAEIEAELIAGLAPATDKADLVQNDHSSGTADQAFGGQQSNGAADEAFGGQTQNQAPTDPEPQGEIKQVENFPSLMALVSELKGAGRITDEQVNAKCSEVAGVDNIALMATKMDLIPGVAAALQQA